MSQYILKEVMNLTFLDFATQTPLAYADYAETTEIDNTATRIDIQGGQGGYVLGSIDWNKRSTMKLKLPLVDPAILAILAGSSITTGAAANLFTREVLTVSGGSATLSQTPVSGTTPYVANLVGQRDFGTQINVVTSAPSANQCSITDKNITFGTGITDGTKVCVVYQYAAPSTTTSFTMTANQQVKPLTIIGSGLVLDQVAGTIVGTNVKIYYCKPQAQFNLTMDMKTPTSIDFNVDLYPQSVNGQLKYYDFDFLT